MVRVWLHQNDLFHVLWHGVVDGLALSYPCRVLGRRILSRHSSDLKLHQVGSKRRQKANVTQHIRRFEKRSRTCFASCLIFTHKHRDLVLFMLVRSVLLLEVVHRCSQRRLGPWPQSSFHLVPAQCLRVLLHRNGRLHESFDVTIVVKDLGLLHRTRARVRATRVREQELGRVHIAVDGLAVLGRRHQQRLAHSARHHTSSSSNGSDNFKTYMDMIMEIEVVDARTLSYEAFCSQYMAQNRPVRLVNVVEKWFPQACAWRVTQDTGEMTINYEYLRVNFGDQEVPVVDGESTEYGCQTRSTMRFADYLDLMQQKRAGKQYLKDWHFVHAVHPSPPLYTTPVYFQDDWLNWWWDRKDESGDDYRFVYIGPAGSWTPLHHDVFRSYSWSANVCGQKEWIFFHPDEESKLKDKFGRTVLPDITSKDYDKDLYPRAHEATPLYVVQDSGEAIFVPSGWYHQVRNVRDTISINHNWFNGFNILEIWSFFKSEYAAVETELEHLKEIGLTGRDFKDQCQLIMQANTGMNYVEFRQLVEAKALDLKEHSIPVSNDWEIKTTENHLNQLLLIQAELDAYFNASEFSS